MTREAAKEAGCVCDAQSREPQKQCTCSPPWQFSQSTDVRGPKGGEGQSQRREIALKDSQPALSRQQTTHLAKLNINH